MSKRSLIFFYFFFLLSHYIGTLQARVVHNSSVEWLQIKEAAENARDVASLEGDEAGEMTCSELLEALELSKCFLLMR